MNLRALALSVGISAIAALPAFAEPPKTCEHSLGHDLCVNTTSGDRDGWQQARLCRRGACVIAFAFEGYEERVIGVERKSAAQAIVVVADDAAPPKHQRRVLVDLPRLERQLLWREVDAHLRGDRFARALALIDSADNGNRKDDDAQAMKPLAWQRVAALYGLGRSDEALAVWRPLVAADPVEAYAAAARYGVLRPTLDRPEITRLRATTAGTARIHADGSYAGGEIAFAPGRRDVAVIESHPCGDDDQRWLAVGASKIPLGRYDVDNIEFHETGVTVANRFLRDFGYRFDPKTEPTLECDGHDDVRYLAHAKRWLVRGALQSKPPQKLTTAACTIPPSVHADPPPSFYVPAIDRMFSTTCVMRGCGDGGTDPKYWSEVPLRRE